MQFLKNVLCGRLDEKPAMILAAYRGRNWLDRNKVLVLIAYLAFTYAYAFAFSLFARFFPLPFVIPLALASLFIIWLLPETSRTPKSSLDVLLLLFVFALFVWPDYLAVSIGSLPWITALRLVCLPMGLVFLVWLSISPALRAELMEALAAARFIWVSVAILTIIAFVSLPLSSRIASSSNKFVVMLFYWTSVFFISAYVFKKERRIHWLVRVVLVSTVIITAIGIVEWRMGVVPWANHIPSFLRVEDVAVQRILAGGARATTGIHRVQSKFATALSLGEFYAYALPILLYTLLYGRGLFVRGVIFLSFPPILFVILKTDSRIGMIGLILSLLLTALTWGARRWKRNHDSLFGPAVVLSYPLLASVIFLLTMTVSRLRAVTWGNGPQAASDATRRAMYEAGIPAILKNPVGHGIGQAADTLGFRNGAGVLTLDAYYLTIALDFGILGFVLYFGMFIYAAYRAALVGLNTRDEEIGYLSAFAVCFINFIVIKAVFSQTENHPFIFLLLGATVALLARHKVIEQQKSRTVAQPIAQPV